MTNYAMDPSQDIPKMCKSGNDGEMVGRSLLQEDFTFVL